MDTTANTHHGAPQSEDWARGRLLDVALLDVVVVWHPEDAAGKRMFDLLNEHFHSPTYAGLSGGAVEVYARSEPFTGDPAGTPLPVLPRSGPGYRGPAQQTVVVLCESRALARACLDAGSGWRTYLEQIHRAAEATRPRTPATAGTPPSLSVLTLRSSHHPPDGSSPVHALFGKQQALRFDRKAEEAVPEAERTLVRNIVMALGRLLRAEESPDRLTIFLSHTKLRAPGEPDPELLVDTVHEVLRGSFLGEFFDAHSIEPGSAWEERIRSAAATSALLMLRTDRYSSRDWTQREVLIAKEHDLPVVCVQALHSGETRGSALMDNVPTIPIPLSAQGVQEQVWDGLHRAVALLVDEDLKRRLWRHQDAFRDRDGFDWTPAHAPEPLTLSKWLSGKDQASRPPEANDQIWIVHPDPPLGQTEVETLKHITDLAGNPAPLRVVTPRTFARMGARLSLTEPEPITARTTPSRPPRIMLSVSPGEDLARWGVSDQHLHLVLGEIAQSVFLAGGEIWYGGSIRENDVCQVIARQVQDWARDPARLRFLLSGSEAHRTTPEELAAFQDEIRLEDDVLLMDPDGRGASEAVSGQLGEHSGHTAEDATLLTEMRDHIVRQVDAVVLVGGKLQSFSGIGPGVLQEAELALRHGTPIYPVGGYGGAARVVSETSRGSADYSLPSSPEVSEEIENRVRDAVARWQDAFAAHGDLVAEGLGPEERDRLAESPRPSDIATVVMLAANRILGRP